MYYKKCSYTHIPDSAGEYIIGADIGGTNANFGIFLIQKNIPLLILSVHYKTQMITSFISVINHLLGLLKNEHALAPTRACIAGAGYLLSSAVLILTHAPLIIDATELITHTSLSLICLANDFEVIPYGIAHIDRKYLKIVRKGVVNKQSRRAIIGAGTGLGKACFIGQEASARYKVMPSEGGHADFPIHNEYEYRLCTFIASCKDISLPIGWEDVLSGTGISYIYNFVKGETAPLLVSPEVIFRGKESDPYSKKVFQLYAAFYGRCAKNFSLEVLCYGGLYIAGGIVAHHTDIVRNEYFLKEFMNVSITHAKIMASIPLIVISDYNVSLYGAAQLLMLSLGNK